MTLIKEEVKTTEIITAENAAELEHGRPMNVPEEIHVPEWLADFLKTVRIPDNEDNQFLIQLGKDVLYKKQEHIEMFNMERKSSKLRVLIV